MDLKDGRIYPADVARRMLADHPETFAGRLVEIAATERQLRRRPPRVGRNEQCPCGSGAKFKKCCMRA